MPRGMRVPENYSGSAFRTLEAPPPPREKTPDHEPPIVFSEPPREEIAVEESPPAPVSEPSASTEPSDVSVAAKPSLFGLRLPFQGLFRSSGLHIGFEELLLIGLILMISQEGKNDDLVWLLILLLLIP
jgi:hypothetical protein